MNRNTLKLFHISDIHFYEANSSAGPTHRHSLKCMRAIESIFKQENPDILIVTGDLTNLGDSVSLDRVHQWLHDRINVSATYYGLGADIPMIVVPGNHDAFNATNLGANLQRWQYSLANYNAAFPDLYLGEHGVDYFWFCRGDMKLFICSVDSCYLGDTDPISRVGALSFSGVAKGKFSAAQSKEIVRLYDRGVRGELEDQDGNKISGGAFLGSFKMMAIHHYLFEPRGMKTTRSLQMIDRRVVFQNIAMADFDALICGHRHYADQQIVRYSDHFERRGRLRYALNHVRRSLGLDSLPLDESQTQGRSLGIHFRLLVSAIYYTMTPQSGMTPKVESDIMDCLERCLRDPTVMKSELMTFVRRLRRGDTETRYFWEAEELIRLYQLIQKHFSRGDMLRLSRSANSLNSVIKKLATRPFIHVAAGSAAKASDFGKKQRSFNVYRILADNATERHVFSTRRYLWNHQKVTPDGEQGYFDQEDLPPVVMPYSRDVDV